VDAPRGTSGTVTVPKTARAVLLDGRPVRGATLHVPAGHHVVTTFGA